MRHLSKNQKKIIELLQIKPDMTTKEIAELTFGRIVEYKSKDYSSNYRSLMSLERQDCIQRVHVQLKWRFSI
jgi:transposase